MFRTEVRSTVGDVNLAWIFHTPLTLHNTNTEMRNTERGRMVARIQLATYGIGGDGACMSRRGSCCADGWGRSCDRSFSDPACDLQRNSPITAPPPHPTPTAHFPLSYTLVVLTGLAPQAQAPQAQAPNRLLHSLLILLEPVSITAIELHLYAYRWR